ncbi:MAG: hypothetical protein H6828_04735 [Planctomycetes bacterium]|nr:hypothetical protein [Planctomycetota bacterium]
MSPGPRGTRDLVLRLERGRLVDVRGEGAAELRERLAQASGDAALLGELCVGLNPVGSTLTGKSSLDGVLAGTLTPSFGSNEVVGGTHRANLDLRFPSRELDLVVNGEVLVSRGELQV